MVRTQIYLTEKERTALQAIAHQTGKTQSELIRQAIDSLVEQFQQENRKALLQQARGIWKERDDLPDFSKLRCELDRDLKTGD
jgi:hypothetical protein